jgi:hypothetical protein
MSWKNWDNIKIDLKGIGPESVGWIELEESVVQWRAFVNTVMNFMVT